MSETTPVTEEATPEVTPETTSDPELDTGLESQVGNDEQTFTITVDGEELEVPLTELKDGYLRRRDYTIKTQEVAELRSFREQYQQNPKAVIQALAEANGMSIAEAKAQAADIASYDEELDPYASKFADMEARLNASEQAKLEQQAYTETNQAISQFDLGIPAETLMAFAIEKGIGNPFTAAELMQAQNQREEKVRQTAQIVEKKRVASVVSGGSGAPSGAVVDDDLSGKSFGEIFAALTSRSA